MRCRFLSCAGSYLRWRGRRYLRRTSRPRGACFSLGIEVMVLVLNLIVGLHSAGLLHSSVGPIRSPTNVPNETVEQSPGLSR